MNQLRKITAIKALFVLVLFWMAGASWAAQVAGTVVQLSGPLLAKRADGTARILSMKSEVESGDTLVTEKNTYAMLKFIDNSEITLKPSTTFKVENFAYDASSPSGDAASFSLVKGGLRSVTGLLGKRNKEKFSMKTPSATIGIRGTTFIVEWVSPESDGESCRDRDPNMSACAGQREPGTYVRVLEGMIYLANENGSVDIGPNQVGKSLWLPPGTAKQGAERKQDESGSASKPAASSASGAAPEKVNDSGSGEFPPSSTYDTIPTQTTGGATGSGSTTTTGTGKLPAGECEVRT
jgi:hypothetical protein